MVKSIYTLWKANEDDEDSALFLETQPLFRSKHSAFKRAHKLAKELAKGWGQVILVRRVFRNSNICYEWVFPPE